jgi:hypothetical protein
MLLYNAISSWLNFKSFLYDFYDGLGFIMKNQLVLVVIVFCLFSFITGVYSTILLQKNRDTERACSVTFKKGNETHVLIGSWR